MTFHVDDSVTAIGKFAVDLNAGNVWIDLTGRWLGRRAPAPNSRTIIDTV